jgi:UrcA family protein
MNQVQGKFSGLAFAAALATTGVTLLSLAAPAGAADFGAKSASARSEGVRYTDLNLASAEGRDRLEDRVRNVAERLCETGGSPAPAAAIASAKCVRRAVAAAAPQIEQAIASQRRQFAARALAAD